MNPKTITVEVHLEDAAALVMGGLSYVHAPNNIPKGGSPMRLRTTLAGAIIQQTDITAKQLGIGE